MARDEATLQRAARRAYELGRLRLGLGLAWPALALLPFSLWCCRAAPACWALDAALFGSALLLGWWGRGAARAVWPGYLAGAAPLLLPALAPRAWTLCVGPACLSWCALLCPLTGLAAGVAVGLLASREEADRSRFLLAGALVAGLTGSLGCSALGLGGVLGMLAAGALGAVPTFVALRPRAA